MQLKKSSRILRVFGYLRPFWKTAAGIVALTLVTSGLNSVEPMIQKVLIDALSTGHSPLSYLQTVGQVVLLTVAVLVGFAIFKGVITAISNYLSWDLQLNTKLVMLERAVGKIYNLSLSQHQNDSIGAIMTRLDRGINGLSWAFFDIALTLLPSLLYLFCTVLFMLSMDWRLTVIALAFAPLPAVLGLWSGKVYEKREQKTMAKWVQIYDRFHEGLSLIKTVKSFTLEDRELNRFLGGVEEANVLVRDGVKMDGYFTFVKNICMDLGRLTVLCYGAYLVMNGAISIGTLVAFLSYTGSLFGPMLGLAGMYETIRKTKVYLDTIFDIIDTPDAVQDRPDAREIDHTQITGALSFENVVFGYVPERPVLKNVSFSVKPGMMVAFVGPSGSGKTTVIDLLARYFDPQSGRVLLDGVDIREFKQKSLRNHIAMVLQDTALFNDTIKNNIACARPNATDDEIFATAKAAGVDLFVERKQNRYETVVGERGAMLSGGERQRVAIARAILKDPQIIIFDEASSNLDAESEELVHKAIANLAKTKTVFVIAHRLSTIRDADLIIVLKHGEIVEQGNHEQLLRNQGLYHKLVAVQALSVHGLTVNETDSTEKAPAKDAH
jgi:ATP-binding cassette subfamily B protein